MARFLNLIYCDNCDRLKGVRIGHKAVVFHRPCRPREYDIMRVMYLVAPPGYISRFMREGALRPHKFDKAIGRYLLVARVEPMDIAKWNKTKNPIHLAPDHKTDKLRILLHRNIFGAELRYVLDGDVLRYSDDTGEGRFDCPEDARAHLKECMRHSRHHTEAI